MEMGDGRSFRRPSERRHGLGCRLDTAQPVPHPAEMLPVFEILAAEPTDEELNKVLALLLDFNALHTAHVIDRPHLGIVLKDPNTSEIIGGLYAVDEYNWLFIKYVIVPSALRGKGFGTKLMNEAERIARERAYVGIFLDTFDFQAKPFYLKLGFEQFGELEGDEQTPRRFFLKKVFSGE
ncbi:GNAT family N-acetyltransferase [Rhizobium sp. MC63]|uniref:GNAT family N-acetyltransferase n=1 Tax=Rhizobium mulingense TaxID=3031128 RepID=A0ACC6MWU3_9HYPH|nr:MULTISPECIES: GNAT family N-acetyltransferase [unclassified Rhizobium]MDF0699916.1 GNAT family N-acetyltransferase [Rhizobium sp. MC63]MEA3517799.1 GNAT family N-acetyltransferase [Rhizobium sp. MJ31]MEB3046583.1 GNAT family N-acetyltransferase [Rhizobium sp. MJ21]